MVLMKAQGEDLFFSLVERGLVKKAIIAGSIGSSTAIPIVGIFYHEELRQFVVQLSNGRLIKIDSEKIGELGVSQ
jgi:hypothetical protein